MARNFVAASTERINLSFGAGGSLTGAYSLAGIVRPTSDGLAAGRQIVCIGDTAATMRRLGITSTNLWVTRSGNTNSNSTTTALAANGWTFIAVTKAAGTSTPRFHIYNYTTKAWTHENGSAAIADSTPTTASFIGVHTATTGPWDGDIAACGAWRTALTDAQAETLAFSLTPWFSYTPNGLWVLDQASTATKVWDLTGNGANQSGITGTTVATTAVPVWNRGARPVVVTQSAPAVTANTGQFFAVL